MGKSPHRSQEWHSSRPCKHGSNISPFALGRGHEDSRVRLPADEPRASAVPGRREGLCPGQRVAVMFSRPTFVSPRATTEMMKSTFDEGETRYPIVARMGKQSDEPRTARFFRRETFRAWKRKKKSAWRYRCVSHQGTRSAARGFRQRGAGFRALRAFAATDRIARRSRLERASSRRASVGDEPDTHTAAAAARCLAPAPTPCSARRRRSS